VDATTNSCVWISYDGLSDDSLYAAIVVLFITHTKCFYKEKSYNSTIIFCIIVYHVKCLYMSLNKYLFSLQLWSHNYLLMQDKKYVHM
jgi:hypothetical protein